MDRPTSEDDEDDFLYDYLLDTGVLNDVHTVAESIVSSSSVSSSVDLANSDLDLEDDARRVADRLLDQNADDVERALDAIVRNVKLATEAGQLVDFRWPQLLDIGPSQPPRKTLRNLNALVRLPFTYDTYTGAYFRKLTKGLEQTIVVDAFFEPTVRVYAKLVDMAPDFESAAESFESLCEATHLRCLRQDFGKTVTSVCLLMRCLSVICKRGAGSKNLKPAIVEFVATVMANPNKDNSPYVVFCCADPTAQWFDRVSKFYSSRSAFFECLDNDRGLLKTVVSSFCSWMAEPKIPKSEKKSVVVGKYACFLHSIHLLAKMLKYQSARTMFPVKVSRTTRIHVVNISNYCFGFLSANRDEIPKTLASGLCKLVATIASFRAREVIDSVMENLSKFNIRILAETMEHPSAFEAVIQREDVVGELFKKRYWKDNMDALVKIADMLSRHHEYIWRFVTRRMPFLEAVTTKADRLSDDRWSLMVNIRCTPLSTLTYDLEDDSLQDNFDWLDPSQKLLFSVACASHQGIDWLNRIGAFSSLDRFIETRLNEVEYSLDPDGQKLLDPIVDVAYSYCMSVEGLKILLDDSDSDLDIFGRVKLTQLYYLSYESFDGHSIVRDVLIMLWLRLIEAATHSFSLRVYADTKLKYQDTLLKLAADNRTDNGTVFVDETTELLTKLQCPFSSAGSTSNTVGETGGLTEILKNVDHHGTGDWSQRVRNTIVRSDQISGPDMVDLLISFGRRSSNDQLDLQGTLDRKSMNPTDFYATGIRLALRYGSTVGLVSDDSTGTELEHLLYDSVERRGPGLFDCMICTLFIASQGSKNKSAEACAVLRKLVETTRFVWPPAVNADVDLIAAFGHLSEGILQQELPEVHNAFKISGISWWLLCSGWMSDCFWGHLSWPEICRWLCLVGTFSVDYQAYYFVCLAVAQKRKWLEAFVLGRFRETVYQGDFGDFRLAEHADYLESLAKKYHRFITKKLVSEFDMN